MKASYCNIITGMHKIRHGSKSVVNVDRDGSVAFFTAGSWHSCRTRSGAIAVQSSAQLGGLCHLQGGLGDAQRAVRGTFRAQWD